jgi:hypothetical protein
VQINQVAVPAEDGVYDAASVERWSLRSSANMSGFTAKAAGYAAAGFTLTGLQVHGTAKLSELRVGDLVHQGVSDAHDSVKGRREISWYGRGGDAEMTPVYDGARLDAGFTAAGRQLSNIRIRRGRSHGCTAEIDPTAGRHDCMQMLEGI